MKFAKLLPVLFLIQPLCAAFAHGTDILATSAGPVSGRTENGISIFLGIPYAAPPVGNLRWKPPQKPARWKEVRISTSFGHACPQPTRQEGGDYSEDCLYLNVWTPQVKAEEKLPVMVWIHGGGFNFGSAAMPEYDGKNLAGKGVVVVSLNYRLGPLGFLSHAALVKETEDGTSGNYGLLDQMAALKWVRDNIGAFGGDRENVTIFGQSAGSRSVSLLLISPLSKGLFHRAIAQSGGPIIGSEYLSPNFDGDPGNALRMGGVLAERLGCGTAADIAACMRLKTADEVIKAAACKTDIFDDGGAFFAPVLDGQVLPRNPRAAFIQGKQHDVPLIAGSTLNEGAVYLSSYQNIPEEKYTAFLKAHFGKDYEKAQKVFPIDKSGVAAALDRLITVGANAHPARFMAGAGKRSKAYLFQFTRRPGTEKGKKLGVFHGADLAYVFGNMKETEGDVRDDFALSARMMDYWVNFAKTGNPNGKGLPIWPAYDTASDGNIEFGDDIVLRKGLFSKECDFIEQHSRYAGE